MPSRSPIGRWTPPRGQIRPPQRIGLGRPIPGQPRYHSDSARAVSFRKEGAMNIVRILGS